MTVNDVINAALSPLPYEISRPPAKGSEQTYLSWFEVDSHTARQASNQRLRTEYLMQVDIYTKQPLIEQPDAVKDALRAAGLKIDHAGPEDYEEDTGYRHLPIRCRWIRKEN